MYYYTSIMKKDQFNKYVFSAVLLMFIVVVFPHEPKQLSSSYYFKNYVENTTHVDIFDNGLAQIYVNNAANPAYFLNTTEERNFEYKLGRTSYPYDVVHKAAPQKKNNSVVDYLLLFFVGYVFMKFRAIGGHTRCIVSEDNVSVKLEDIAGLEDAKKEVFEFVDFLKNREKYIKCGARMPRGALLHGPPGCGKTMLAKAVAGECGVPFIAASGSDFCEMYVGVGPARVRNLFKKAREKAPCIVFIDEIDALARKRSHSHSGSGSSERDSALNKLLIELDGFEPNDNVLIFAATNRLDILDDALMRPGRFDRKIRFELPERGDREKIFQIYLENMKLDTEPDMLSEALSKQSFGFSGADIANICNEACILSVRCNSENVTRKILENAVDNVLLGPEKKTFRLSDKEKRIVAYHESGHSVMSYMLENVKPPIKVSIMPRGKSALGFSQSEMNEDKLRNKDELFERMCVLLGGRVAEEIFCENITTGASDDIEKLTRLAYMYVTRYGMDDSIGTFHFDRERRDIYSETLRKKVDTAVQKIINRAYKKTKEMLEEHSNLIEKFAKKLLEKETVNQVDIDIIFSGTT